MEPQRPRTFLSFDIAGLSLLPECVHPEADCLNEGYDVPLTPCSLHQRTAYYCLDCSRIWCDGFDGTEYHPHHLTLLPEPSEDDQ